MPFSVLLLIKNQQYFIFKKINSSCQLLAGYTHIKTFYRSLLNLQKGLHSRSKMDTLSMGKRACIYDDEFRAQILFSC